MTKYLGDFAAGQTVQLHFTTHAANGSPVAPSSAFVAADFRIYKDGSDTQRSSSAGVTVASPFDSVAGRHCVTVNTADNTDAGFYVAGHDYRVEINSAKTVDGVSQSGVEIGSFSLQNRYVPPTSSGGLDAAGVRAALGMSAANLDTQLAGLPAAIESAIINDGDATALLQAIADKIAAENPSLGDLTLAAIASAVWANGTRSLSGGVALTSGERSTLAGAIATLLATNHGSGSWESVAPELSPEDVADIAAAVAVDVGNNLRTAAYNLLINRDLQDSGEIRVTQRDDYAAADGRAFELLVEKEGVDFAAATVVAGAGSLPGAPVIAPTASLHDKAVGSCVLRLEFTSASLAVAPGRYNWDAHIVLAGRRNTVISGTIIVEPKYADAPA